MPSHFPYPEVEYSLDTSEYKSGTHNITAVAIDKANNKKETSISVKISEDRIPGSQTITLFAGTLLGVIIVFTRYLKRRHYRENK